MKYQVVKPNYNNSLLNLIASIKKHFGLTSEFNSINELDEALKDKKHVVLFLLDGMGKKIIDENLDASNFLNKNIKKVITSVFPPTTVAATTALNSGIAPSESGWIGWQQYFSDLNRCVTLFSNVDYYSGEKVNINVGETYLKYQPIVEQLKSNGINANELYPSFKENGFINFSDMCDEVYKICKKDEKTYTYAYWDKPDYLIHEHGCNNDIIKSDLQNLNDHLEELAKKLPSDTLLIVTADHGLIDVEPIILSYYPKVMKYVTKPVSLEGRAAVFFVDKPKQFKNAFLKAFSEWFDLYSYDEFEKSGYLPGKLDKVKQYLGDFIAIAKDKYYFISTTDTSFVFKAHHAGSTDNEMYVPLIYFSNK